MVVQQYTSTIHTHTIPHPQALPHRLATHRTKHSTIHASAAPAVVETVTPTLRVAERAKSVPLATACSAEGQAAREALLKDAVVLFICAGYPKKRFIYERARALGIKAVLIDSPNHWGKDVVGEVFDGFYPVDLSRDTETAFADMLATYDKIVEVCFGWKKCVHFECFL